MLQWLSDQVRLLWAGLNNVGRQVATEVSAALRTVTGWISRAKDELYGWASYELWRLNVTLRNVIHETGQSVRAWVEARLPGIISDFQGWLTYQVWCLTVTVRNLIHEASAGIRQWVENLIPGIVSDVEGWVTYQLWCLGVNLRNLIHETTDGLIDRLLGQGALGKLLHFLQDLYYVLEHIWSDPMGWLTAWLSHFLVPFLADLLADEMGTVKYELGPGRIWGKRGGSGGPIYTGMPPEVGELVAPLPVLWVDGGNRFGPGHPRLDLQLANGQPVYAMHDGVATVRAFMAAGYGNWVTLDGPPWWTLYGHLLRSVVGSGDRVRKGEMIAYGDDTGRSTGPHLHLEIKYRGAYVDPASILPVT